MNTIKPIPPELLSDSFELLVPYGSGFDRTYITDVRVVKNSAIADYRSLRTRDETELVIYYDCTNSMPSRMDFCAGMQIYYFDELYEISEAKLFGGEAPHHWRLKARKISSEEGYNAAE